MRDTEMLSLLKKQPRLAECIHCKAKVSMSGVTCPHCGKQNPPFVECRSCQKAIPATSRECPNCGEAQKITKHNRTDEEREELRGAAERLKERAADTAEATNRILIAAGIGTAIVIGLLLLATEMGWL